jgi:hypothetical protein
MLLDNNVYNKANIIDLRIAMEHKIIKPPEIDLQKIINSEEVHKTYVNGFATFRGNSDMGVVFICNGKTNLLVNMSFTLAKTLSEKLARMVDEFEEITGIEIITTDIIDEKNKQKKAIKNSGNKL